MSAMTTTASIEITCPHWCSETAQSHADALWNMGGTVIHRGAELSIGDDAGFGRPLEEPVPAQSVTLGLTAETTPNNRPQGAPVIYLDGADITVQQAEQIAAALLELVALARA